MEELGSSSLSIAETQHRFLTRFPHPCSQRLWQSFLPVHGACSRITYNPRSLKKDQSFNLDMYSLILYVRKCAWSNLRAWSCSKVLLPFHLLPAEFPSKEQEGGPFMTIVASRTPPARGFQNLDLQFDKHVLVIFLVRSKDEVSDCASHSDVTVPLLHDQ